MLSSILVAAVAMLMPPPIGKVACSRLRASPPMCRSSRSYPKGPQWPQVEDVSRPVPVEAAADERVADSVEPDEEEDDITEEEDAYHPYGSE